MTWTTPRDWTDNEVVSAALLNTHVRDNLDYLKSDPVIAQAVNTGYTDTANQQNVLVVSVSATIPSDIGACFVEVWSHYGYGMTSSLATGHNLSGVYVSDGSTVIIDGRKEDLVSYGVQAYYARSDDLSWAGLSKTVSVYIDGYNYVGGANARMGPTVIRIVRSY